MDYLVLDLAFVPYLEYLVFDLAFVPYLSDPAVASCPYLWVVDGLDLSLDRMVEVVDRSEIDSVVEWILVLGMDVDPWSACRLVSTARCSRVCHLDSIILNHLEMPCSVRELGDKAVVVS